MEQIFVCINYKKGRENTKQRHIRSQPKEKSQHDDIAWVWTGIFIWKALVSRHTRSVFPNEIAGMSNCHLFARFACKAYTMGRRQPYHSYVNSINFFHGSDAPHKSKSFLRCESIKKIMRIRFQCAYANSFV